MLLLQEFSFLFQISSSPLLSCKNRCIKSGNCFLVTTLTDRQSLAWISHTFFRCTNRTIWFVYIPPRFGFRTFKLLPVFSLLWRYWLFPHFKTQHSITQTKTKQVSREYENNTGICKHRVFLRKPWATNQKDFVTIFKVKYSISRKKYTGHSPFTCVTMVTCSYLAW